MARASARAPTPAHPPPRSTNRHAASTFGPIDPGAATSSRKRVGVVSRIACWVAVPHYS
jgi:hypothetical protein